MSLISDAIKGQYSPRVPPRDKTGILLAPKYYTIVLEVLDVPIWDNKNIDYELLPQTRSVYET